MENSFFSFPVFQAPAGLPEQISGQNARGIALITMSGASDAADESFLEKILSAVKCDLRRDALLIKLTPQKPWSYSALQQKFACKQVLFFGADPVSGGLHLQMELYQPVLFRGQWLLRAQPLSVIATDKQHKAQLWSALQQLFPV